MYFLLPRPTSRSRGSNKMNQTNHQHQSNNKTAVFSNNNANPADIQQHLQSIFNLLRPEDTLKMAVRLESIHPGRIRYLVVITCPSDSKPGVEESCLLGIDCKQKNETTVGLVLAILADTKITLDGDGGFSILVGFRYHIFKPISVQAMWSSLQTLHRAADEARNFNFYAEGSTHIWTSYYSDSILSDRSCLNEWNALDGLTSKRPPSPDLCTESRDQTKTKELIRSKLKEIMTSVDLDEVTSKFIRTRLEEDLGRKLTEYKSFIDEEMLLILGQMDTATEIFSYLYLGSEWNASNLEELKMKGVGKILNVTREIDNFYPGAFDYYNVRVYDDDSTEMLKHWDKTYRYIWKAMEEGSKVLVHCKMGISRSASVVIAYVMKAKNWNLNKALAFVKNKRSCIKPNENFLKQLEVYQGILSASKQRHNSLWRSKSETNFNHSCSASSASDSPTQRTQVDSPGMIPTMTVTADNSSDFGGFRSRGIMHNNLLTAQTSDDLFSGPGPLSRPKSWSPDDSRLRRSNSVFGLDSSMDTGTPFDQTPPQTPQRKHRHRFGTDPSCYLIYQAREKIMTTSSSSSDESSDSGNDSGKEGEKTVKETGTRKESITAETIESNLQSSPVIDVENVENMSNPNVNSPSPSRLPRVNSVKERISELEMQTPKRKRSATQAVKINSRAGLVLNLANQFETSFGPKSFIRSPPGHHHRHHHGHHHSHHHHTHHHHHSSSIPIHSRSFNYHDMNKPIGVGSNQEDSNELTMNIDHNASCLSTSCSRDSNRPPIPSPRSDSLRYSNHSHHHHSHPWSRFGTSVGLISRRGTGGKAQSTPEEIDPNTTQLRSPPTSSSSSSKFRESDPVTHLQHTLSTNSMSMTSSSLTMLNRLFDSSLMTEISVVPHGTVSRTKEQIENLKRTHSFENRLTRPSGTTASGGSKC